MALSAGDRSVADAVATTLGDHPVRLGLLFGSRARDDAHATSDIDVGVVFEHLQSGDPGYSDALLDLGADLAVELGTDAIDVVDLQRAPPSLVRTAFDEGTLLVGDDRSARQVRERLVRRAADDDAQSPAERFDQALSAIDDHLA